LTAFVQVSDVLSDLAHNEESVAAHRRAVAAAAANLRDTQADYRLGGGALLAVIDAQRQLNRVRRESALAEGLRLQSVVQLFTATAADWRAAAPAQSAQGQQAKPAG
jgi:outer membrane protein TolC